MAVRFDAVLGQLREKDVTPSPDLSGYVHVYGAGNQTISNITVTTVIFDTEIEDSLGEYSTSTGIFTAKDAGVYNVGATIIWLNTNAEKAYYTYLYSSAWAKPMYFMDYPGEKAVFTQTISANVKLAAGQTIYIRVYQDSGGDETLLGGAVGRKMTITKVS
jgi:hypothetical protein